MKLGSPDTWAMVGQLVQLDRVSASFIALNPFDQITKHNQVCRDLRRFCLMVLTE